MNSSDKTIADFGDQWTTYTDNTGNYRSGTYLTHSYGTEYCSAARWNDMVTEINDPIILRWEATALKKALDLATLAPSPPRTWLF